MKSHSLLLVEPDAMIRQTLAEMLEAAGHRVQAVEAAADWDGFDLVVGDSAALTALSGSGIPSVIIVKPVRIAALLAKVEEMLNRPAPTNQPSRMGKWRFVPAARLLEDGDGTKVRLTDKETAILEHLKQAGGVVDRDTLLAEVWGYSAAISTHTLETHIYRLRRKIESDPANATLLVTEPGGYRLADEAS